MNDDNQISRIITDISSLANLSEFAETVANQDILRAARNTYHPGMEVEINIPYHGWARARVDQKPLWECVEPDEAYGARIHVTTYAPIIYAETNPEVRRQGRIPVDHVRPYRGDESD